MSATNLPDIKRLKREDIPGAATWIDPILDNQGRFNEVVYNALNGDLRYGENQSSQIYTTSFTFSTGTQPEIKLRTNKAIMPQGIVVIRYRRDDNGAIDSPIGCQFDYADSVVTIRPSMTPLVDTKKYTLTFLVIFQ